MFIVRKTTNIKSLSKGEEPHGYNFPLDYLYMIMLQTTYRSIRLTCIRTDPRTLQTAHEPSANFPC